MNPNQLDLEDWELLPDEGFLEINDDGVGVGGKKIYSRVYPKASTTVFQTNYFICPTKFVETARRPDDLLNLETREKEDLVQQEEMKIQLLSPKKILSGDDLISQVFFKKTVETEYLDIRVESPKSRGIVPPQIESGAFQYEGKEVSVDANLELGEETGGGPAVVVQPWWSSRLQHMEVELHRDRRDLLFWSGCCDCLHRDLQQQPTEESQAEDSLPDLHRWPENESSGSSCK